MTLSFSALTDLPTPPQRTDPDNFAARADTFVDALDDFQVEMNTVIAELNQITSGLDGQEVTAVWASGTSYDFPDVVAASDGHTYRCIDTNVVGQNPVTDDGTYWLRLSASSTNLPPVGSIIAWIGGYFTNSTNGSFTSVLANTAAEVNSLLNDSGWYVCDGSSLNLSTSTIYNGANRYLPNLDDDRFLMGDTVAGGSGGSSTHGHTHSMLNHTHSTNVPSFTSGATTISSSQMPSHTHGQNAYTGGTAYGVNNPPLRGFSDATVANGTTVTDSAGSGSSHTHSINPPAQESGGPNYASTGGASVTENRPKYLSCFYIMRVV